MPTPAAAAPSSTAPLFIIGTERSGSNLLRVILDAHPRIVVPHPPHVMNYFGGLEASYGDLSDPVRLRALADDIVRLVRLHIHPWDFVPDAARMVEDADPQDLFGLFYALYDQARERAGAARWGCKSTFMIHHVDRVLARDPDAGLLWLVRDPRDVAASSRTSVFSPCHPRHSAALWARQQAEGLRLQRELGDRLFRLHYEDLLADPEGELRRLCAHIGEDFDPAMLAFDQSARARQTAKLSASWKNADKGILRDNAQRWRTKLSPEEVAEVEATCAGPMEELGYERDHPDAPPPATDLSTMVDVWAHEALWRAKVELKSLQGDQNHWRRWGRRAYLSGLWLKARARG
jgi:hypothetical protein